ncbi:MAG: DAK2 domain-containing protein [Chloroflexaceae bacterium]|nr:DAK2 domain-containing protein [Chloroflexaceae bacterium]
MSNELTTSTEHNLSLASTHDSWDGNHFLQAFRAGEQWLLQHVPHLNQLNVFPVPDGDTGTNMHLTLTAALYSVVPAASCALVLDQVYRGALMGARGNSGVILSQILHGLAKGLSNHDVCGPEEFAQALEKAAESAYSSTSNPREGTILTVIRETSEAVKQAIREKRADMLTVLQTAVQAARDAVERTPELLQVLREANVVDAGGKGLYIILEGMLRWARGDSLVEDAAVLDAQASIIPNIEELHGEDEYGFCTNLLLKGINMPRAAMHQHFNEVGTSVVVVGDDSLLRVHVHTLRPGDILNYAMQFGEAIKIEIANMDQQRREIQEQQQHATSTVPLQSPTPTGRVGVVAVAPGAGFAEIFRSFGVEGIVSGGQTANPSTQELLAAVEQLAQDEVIILPNNSNILLAAEQAARMSSKRVAVVPSRTVPQGITAMVRFQPDDDLDENIATMLPELKHVVTAEVTTAVRDVTLGGVQVQAGHSIAVLDGTLVAADSDIGVVIDTMLERIQMDQHEYITIYYGQRIAREQAHALAQRLQERYPDYTIELLSGGQPVYDYIFAAE